MAPRILIFDDAHAIGLRESMKITGSPRSSRVRVSATVIPSCLFVIMASPSNAPTRSPRRLAWGCTAVVTVDVVQQAIRYCQSIDLVIAAEELALHGALLPRASLHTFMPDSGQ